MVVIDIKVTIKTVEPSHPNDHSVTKQDDSAASTNLVSTSNIIHSIRMNYLNQENDLVSQESANKAKNGLLRTTNQRYQLSVQEYIEQEYPDWRDSGSIYEISDIAFAYTDVAEMESRRHRFPSIAQRVRLYMSNWYLPPCPQTQRIQYQYMYHHPESSSHNIRYFDNHTDDKNFDTAGTSVVTPTGNTTNVSYVMVQEISLHRPLQTKFEDYVHIPYKPPRRFQFDSVFQADDTIHLVDRQQFIQCKHRYCIDLKESFLPFIDRNQHHQDNSTTIEPIPIPVLFQFGDSRESKPDPKWNGQPQRQRLIRNPRIPVIQKTRNSLSQSELLYVTDASNHTCYRNGERRTPKYNPKIHHDKNMVLEYQQFHLEPIIFKLNIHRHYVNVFHLIRNVKSVKWEDKRNSACFRGALTGRYPPMKVRDFDQLSSYDRCQLLPRCYFTYIHHASTLIDAKLTKIRTDKKIPTSLRLLGNGTGRPMDLIGDALSMEEMLQYKAIVVLQGNDVSSGLKWALFSNSVVMMPIPTVTSWAMEESLIPWVHYVPIEVYTVRNDTPSVLDQNGTPTNTIMTDAEEKMQWIINNDRRAQEIAHAGTLWIADLLLHPLANTDELEIFDEMAQRYLSHFSIL
jgi:hypothetical protein